MEDEYTRITLDEYYKTKDKDYATSKFLDELDDLIENWKEEQASRDTIIEDLKEAIEDYKEEVE